MGKQKTRRGRKNSLQARTSRANAVAVLGILAGLIIIGTQVPSILRHGAAQEETAEAPVVEGPSDQEVQDAEQHLGYQWESVEGREEELRNLHGVADSGAANEALVRWRQNLEGMESALASRDLQTFWDLNDQQYDLSWEVNDAFTALYAQEGYTNFADDLKNRGRELKDIERNLKDLKRQAKGDGVDIVPLEQLLTDFQSQLDAIRAEYESLSSSDPDLEDRLEDLRYRLYNELDFSVYWDLQQDLQETVNAASTKKDAERYAKDLEKTIRSQERDVKNLGKGTDVSGLQAILEQRKTVLEGMRELLFSSVFDWEAYRDLESESGYLDQDFWDLHGEFSEQSNLAQQEKDALGSLKDKQGKLKDMERRCKQEKCSGDTLELLEEFKAMVSRMEIAIEAQDFDSFWWDRDDFDSRSGDFWDALNVVQEVQNIGRGLKDITRELKDKARWVRDLAKEAKRGEIPSEPVRELEGILAAMEDAARRANGAYQAQEHEEANDILNEDFNDLRQEFEAITFSIQEDRNREYQGMELEQTVREIERAEEHIRDLLASGDIGPKHAELCLSYTAQGKEYFKQIRAIQESGGEEAIMEEVMIRFEELGRKAERDCAELFEDEGGRDYTAYTDTYVSEEYQDTAEDVLSRLTESLADIVVNALTQNSSLFNALIEQVGDRFQEQVARTLEATAYLPEEIHDELLSRKAVLLKDIERLEKEVEDLRTLAQKERDRLAAIREQLAEHSFVSEEGTRVEEEIETFLTDVPALDAAGIRERIAELEGIAHEAIERDAEIAYEEDLVPFLDTRIGVWYTPYAAMAKDQGFVDGTGVSGGTEFDPAGTANVAEAMKMFANIVGIDPYAKAGSVIGSKMPDWARQPAATLEGYNGLDLDSVFAGNDAADAVTRAQMAQLIQALFELPEGDTSAFADINGLPARIVSAIGAVNSAGIMTGQADGTFAPYKFLNRAELAAILTRVQGTGQ